MRENQLLKIQENVLWYRTDTTPGSSGAPVFNDSWQVVALHRAGVPELTPEMQALCAINRQARVGEDPFVLPYHHFSIVMNKERKLAFYTAVNIDGKISYRLSRSRDKWISDPRIGRNEQTDNSLYANNPLDRGHLVRRLDPAWGRSERVARVANDDTFHFTNCSPQHENFNQNDLTWQGLEDYILDNAIAEDIKVSVFTGPVLSDEDEFYQGLQLPRQFWKVIVMVKNSQLSATAYLLSQTELIQNLTESDLTEAFADDQKVAHFQVPVRQIEELTGLKFGSLSLFDPLAKVESTTAINSITSFRDVLF